MEEIDWNEFRRRHLIDVWRALPDGCRLRVRVYGAPMGEFGPAFTEALALAYSNRVVLAVRQRGKEVRIVVSPVDDPRERRVKKVACWDW